MKYTKNIILIFVITLATTVYASAMKNSKGSEKGSEKGSMKGSVTEAVKEPKMESIAQPSSQSFSDSEVHAVVKKNLDTKSAFSGKVDIYDSNQDKVRHLKVIKIQDGVSREGDVYTAKVETSDTDSREPVFLNVLLENQGGMLTLKALSIAEVLEAVAVVKKEWSDAEILGTMNDHLSAKAKTSGTIDIYDTTTKKVLNLNVVELSKDIRRFGKLLIATATCKDRNSEANFDVDVTLEDKEGELKLKSMRLKK